MKICCCGCGRGDFGGRLRGPYEIFSYVCRKLVPHAESYRKMMEENKEKYPLSEVLEVAAEAGHILLENGAEIARIEETMERISSHYGVTSRNFYVISNGIFMTGMSPNGTPSDRRSQYANVEFIPIKGTQMDKIVEVNRLSREIAAGKHSLAGAREKLAEIRAMKPKPDLEQIAGSAFGSAGFCAIFGGGIMDCCACFVVGMLLWAFVLYVTSRHFAKLLGNIISGAFAALLCLVFWKIGFGESLGNMTVGALIPLIPGVAFTNGIRDLANEDYLSGVTRLLDALLVFLAIAIGSCFMFIIGGQFDGEVIRLGGALSDPSTAGLLPQIVAGFVGTMGFAVLFGAPRAEYVWTGMAGALCWCSYLLAHNTIGISVFGASIIAAFLTTLLAKGLAISRKCPETVFLITGLFPLIPGGGIFWTTYFLCSSQFHSAFWSGVTAISVTFAIVLGIVFVSGLPKHLRMARKAG